MNALVTNGLSGADVIPDTNVHAGLSAFALHALGGDVVFDTVVGNWGNGLNGLTLSNGDTIFGIFTSVKLTSGICAAYRR